MHMTVHPWRGIRPWQRHSLVLSVAGTVYVLIGLSYIVSEPSATRSQALAYALLWLPAQGWGVVFVVTGLLAIISSRWPPISRTWGYTVLTGLSAGWAAFYAAGIIWNDAAASNWSSVFSWGLVSFLWWAISGLVNPPVVVRIPAPEHPAVPPDFRG